MGASLAVNGQTFMVNGPGGVLARVRVSASLPPDEQKRLVYRFAAAPKMESALMNIAQWARQRDIPVELRGQLRDALEAARGQSDRGAEIMPTARVERLIAPGCDSSPIFEAEISSPFTPRRFVEIRATNHTHAYRYARSRGLAVLSLSVAESDTSKHPTTQQGET